MITSTLLLIVGLLAAAGQPTDYVATVVEYAPVMQFEPASRAQAQAIMMENLASYESHIAAAVTEHSSQIVVFPEDGLYGAYFPTRDWALPYLEQLPDASALPLLVCNNTSLAAAAPVLARAGCLAARYGVHLVLVMGDVQPCTPGASSPLSPDPCPDDGRYQFNTQVAFDPAGVLLAKYHKTNLYFEPEWNAGNGLPVSFLAASIGVRFGMMICFDIMRNQPQQALLADPAVTDVVFSSWWVNNAPQITSTQQQQAWARINGRNLLAAGIGRGWYNSGSGLYAAGGRVLRTFYNPTNKFVSRSLTAVVPVLAGPAPIVPPPPPPPSLPPVYPAPAAAAAQLVPLAASSGSYQVAAGPLRCQVNFTGARLLAAQQSFAVVAQYGFYNGVFNASICSLNRCATPADCLAWTTDSAALFDTVSLTASIDAASFDFVLPMLNSDQAQLFDNAVYQKSQLTVASDQVVFTADVHDAPLLNVALFAVSP